MIKYVTDKKTLKDGLCIVVLKRDNRIVAVCAYKRIIRWLDDKGKHVKHIVYPLRQTDQVIGYMQVFDTPSVHTHPGYMCGM